MPSYAIIVNFSTIVKPMQLLAVVQHYQIVAVCGPSCSGKTSAIQTAVETLRQMPSPSHYRSGHINCTTIAVGAMREDQLLGFQSVKDGLVLTNLCSYMYNFCSCMDILVPLVPPLPPSLSTHPFVFCR